MIELNKTDNLLRIVELEKLKKNLFKSSCTLHFQQPSYICLNIRCINDWDRSILCEECYKDHSKLHEESQEYLNYQDAFPKHLEKKANDLINQRSKILPELLHRVDEIVDDYEKLIATKVAYFKQKIKKFIKNRWEADDFMTKIEDFKSKCHGDEVEILNLYEIIEEKLMKICFAANKNCKLYSILERISNSNLEELYNIKDYVEKQFKFMTEIFQQTLIKLDNNIPNDDKNTVNKLNLSRMTFYKDSSINLSQLHKSKVHINF